eukprot:TRINITY_DN9773_c0_g1_i2.p1 TRINITY_DN9773_c0_g1~~TRINITY_DN9773_c0_g1_i2.p1  ORF type:complete len:210 (+),score=22.02 TRINITY_DN9773_c0_g1_i2:285-914(+)
MLQQWLAHAGNETLFPVRVIMIYARLRELPSRLRSREQHRDPFSTLSLWAELYRSTPVKTPQSLERISVVDIDDVLRQLKPLDDVPLELLNASFAAKQTRAFLLTTLPLGEGAGAWIEPRFPVDAVIGGNGQTPHVCAKELRDVILSAMKTPATSRVMTVPFDQQRAAFAQQTEQLCGECDRLLHQQRSGRFLACDHCESRTAAFLQKY